MMELTSFFHDQGIMNATEVLKMFTENVKALFNGY